MDIRQKHRFWANAINSKEFQKRSLNDCLFFVDAFEWTTIHQTSFKRMSKAYPARIQGTKSVATIDWSFLPQKLEQRDTRFYFGTSLGPGGINLISHLCTSSMMIRIMGFGTAQWTVERPYINNCFAKISWNLRVSWKGGVIWKCCVILHGRRWKDS